MIYFITGKKNEYPWVRSFPEIMEFELNSTEGGSAMRPLSPWLVWDGSHSSQVKVPDSWFIHTVTQQARHEIFNVELIKFKERLTAKLSFCFLKLP